jgi:hypothetical protein
VKSPLNTDRSTSSDRSSEQIEARPELFGDVGHAHHPHPGGGEFERQRQAVEAAADLRDGCGVPGPDAECRVAACGRQHEQSGSR